MKLNNIVCNLGLLIAISVVSSCNEFLDEVPSRGDNEVLNRGEQVKNLFANSNNYYTPVDFLVASTDDYGMTMDVFDALGYLDVPSLSGLSWAPEGLDVFMSDELWSKQYNKVFTANAVINDIDNITDVTPEEKAEYLAHAHFVRALAYWELANVYCLPYAEENLNALGLPLKVTTHTDEDLTRASLKNTYAFIEADLKEALKSPRTDVVEGERWLVSQPAVKALMARFYLFTGDYAQAAKYADEALLSQTVSLIDYNKLTTYDMDKGGGGFWGDEDFGDEEGGEGDEYGEGVDNEGENEGEDWPDEGGNILTFCETYNYGSYQFVDYQEVFYPQFYTVTATVNLLASQELTDLYDKDNDLRYINLFVENGLIDYWVYGFNDVCNYHQFSSRNQWGQQMDVFLGASPTIAEMYLTKAEALARQGSWNEAMNVIQTLRVSRFMEGSDFSLSATSQSEALTEILKERRRELPFVMRWYDIRRFAYNETPEDDVELRRTFYTIENGEVDFNTTKEYILSVKSNRYAQPILTQEIQRSRGQIQQNQY